MTGFMKAIVVMEPGDVRVVNDVPIPQIGDYECLVRNRACGYCNATDTHIVEGTLTEHDGLSPYPTLLGHEGAGEVVEVGSKVRNIKVGDKFVRASLRYNPGGPYSRTHGNMAQYGIVSDHLAMREDGIAEADIPFYPNYFPIPRDFDLVDSGVFLCLCESYSAAVLNFGLSADMDILVYGCGPMGLMMMSVLNAIGVKNIIAIDSQPDRLELASKIGCVNQVINFAKENVDEVLAGKTFDAVLDMVGLTSVIMEASNRLRPRGKVCAMGVLKEGNSNVDFLKVQNNTCIHVLNQPYERHLAVEPVVELIREGKLNMKDFYSHVMPMEQINDAIELIKSKQALKVVLTID